MTSTVEHERPAPGHTPERVVFFTDAVFAIAMTLLVIDIPKPEGNEYDVDEVGKLKAAENLVHFLYTKLGSFSAYLLAFCILWLVWRRHHRLFDRVAQVSRRMIALHLPLLLLVGFVPYITGLYEDNLTNPATSGLFSLGIGALLCCRAAIQGAALKDGALLDDVDVPGFKRELRAAWFVGAFFAATVFLCWLAPWTMVAWFAAPLIGNLLDVRRGS